MKPLNPIEVPRDFQVHQPSLPAVQQTPRPEDNKVVGNPDRTPVNKQAALMIQPYRSWLSQPLPDPKLPTKEQKEIDRLTAELKAERNAHAASRDTVGNLRKLLDDTRKTGVMLTRKITQLQLQIAAQAETIRQLEDLKL